MAEMTPIVRDSFIQYAGAVLQSRALVDARDFNKPGARQIFYSMWLHKYTHDKPYEKTNAPLGDAMKDFYIHGDSSLLGILMRSSQPFSMRYPITEVKGNGGTLIASGSWAAERYTSTRLSEIADYLFTDIQKETITEWRDNYADNLQYPIVLPSKGFYNIVNGTSGIATGMASSVPQFNLREVNNALIKLLWNRGIDFDEIYCAPDFATGATLLNATEVKESLCNGTGRACVLRSVIEYDEKERVLTVKEIPYGVYTNTICGQLEEIVESEDNPGIERFNDLTGRQVELKIYLQKNANVGKVLKYLYKNTSLQSWYTINMTVLEDGRYPKIMGWRELLCAHLDHEIEVYIRGFKYDLKKWKERLHIVDGLIAAYDAIDEVVQTIKTSSSAAAANSALQALLSIDEVQAKAILDLKLSKLSKLDINKLQEERKTLLSNITKTEAILNDETLLKKEIEKGLREVADKFGDARRTKILDVETEESEPVEVMQLQVSLTNEGNVYAAETSSLYSARRGGSGNKLKLAKNEYIMTTQALASDEKLLLFTQCGNVYHFPAKELPLNNLTHINNFVSLKDGEKINTIAATNSAPYVYFFTKKGLIKKSSISDYNLVRRGGAKAIELDGDDEIVRVVLGGNERVGVATRAGNFVIFETEGVAPVGRVARGIKAIGLSSGDEVCAAAAISKDTQFIVSISESGLCKKTSIDEFAIQGRGTKGSKVQKIGENDKIADFCPISSNDRSLLVVSTNSCLKIETSAIPKQSRTTLGVKTIKLGEKNKVIKISIV